MPIGVAGNAGGPGGTQMGGFWQGGSPWGFGPPGGQGGYRGPTPFGSGMPQIDYTHGKTLILLL